MKEQVEHISNLKDISIHDADDETERLLDRFPLSQTELQQLLLLYHHHQDKDDVSATSSSSIILAESDITRAIPELGGMLTRAMDNVFVIPTCTTTTTTAAADQEQRDIFLEAVVSLLGRRGERFLLDALFDAAAAASFTEDEEPNTNNTNTAPTRVLMSLAYRLATVCSSSNNNNNEAIAIAADSCPKGWVQALSTQATVTRTYWKDWAVTKGMQLHSTLPTVFSCVLNLSSSDSTGTQAAANLFCLPTTTTSTNSNNILPSMFSHDELMALAAMGLGGQQQGNNKGSRSNMMPWHALYDSDQDGLSFRIFQQALLGYSGPTMIIIRTKHQECLGYVTRGGLPWKESHKWFSNPDNFDSALFRLSPNWNVYSILQQPPYAEASPTNKTRQHTFHQYLYTPFETTCSMQSAKKPVLRGLAVGGVDADAPRLFLTESLEQCRAGSFDLVFEQGPLLCHDEDLFFDVESLQVWAVLVNESEFERFQQSGRRSASVRDETRHRMAHVDKRQFVDDFCNDGGSMGATSKLYQHRQEVRGRVDFVAHDNARRGYYVQDKRPSVRVMNANGGDDDDDDDDAADKNDDDKGETAAAVVAVQQQVDNDKDSDQYVER